MDDVACQHKIAPGRHKAHQNGVDDDGAGQRHDDLIEHLGSGGAIHAGGFVQGLGNGVEEALGHIVAHAGRGTVDDDQTNGGHMQRQARFGEHLVNEDQGQEAGEHAQNQHQVHQRLSHLETQTGKGIAHSQHKNGLEECSGKAHESRILEPDQKVGLGEQADVVIQTKLFGEQIAGHALVFHLEGLQHQAEEGEEPHSRNHDQHDVDEEVADAAACAGAEAGFPDRRCSFLCHYWKSSSFLVDGITL